MRQTTAANKLYISLSAAGVKSQRFQSLAHIGKRRKISATLRRKPAHDLSVNALDTPL